MAELLSPTDSSCPGAEQLAAFLREELPPADLDAIGVHLSDCPLCGALIHQLDKANDGQLRELCAGFAPVGATDVPDDLWYRRMKVGALRAFSADAKEEEVAPPEQIGQYGSFGRIGRGGMGVVYRAQHLRLKKWVAVKLLPPGRVPARTVARFEREMEVVGRLDHPNIVRATDAGHTNGFHYLAMELIEGSDLAQIVQRYGPLPVAEACELIRQAAIGLQHAHEHGLVHRDIKPSNIMLSAKGEVKLLDLGLALLRGEFTAETLSTSGQVMGTADYMAPEQWDACHEVYIRADVYSLGCTLFTLLTGSPPFGGPAFDTVYKKLRAHHEAPVPPLSANAPIPHALEELVRWMLQKDPALRPQTPEEVARALGTYCSGNDLSRLVAVSAAHAPGSDARGGSIETKTVQALPSGRYPTTASMAPIARRRIRNRTAACLCVLVASLVAFLVWGLNRNQQLDPEPQPETGHTPAPPLLPESVYRTPEPLPRVFLTDKWCDLLDHRPTVVRWPDKAENSWTQFDAAKGTLTVCCQDWGMLAVGDVVGPGFDLEATFIQTPWTGRVGVFFRGREEMPNGATRVLADFLALDPINDQFGAEPAGLSYGEVHKFVAPPHHMNNEFLLPVGLIPRPGGECRLTLNVTKSGLAAVEWNGTAVPDVCKAAAGAARWTGADGSVGIWINHGTAQFRSIRVRLNPLSGEHK